MWNLVHLTNSSSSVVYDRMSISHLYEYILYDSNNNIKWMNFWRIMCLLVFLEILAYDWWIAIVTRALLCRSGQYEHEWCHWARILRTKNNECLFIKNIHIPICKNLKIALMIRKQIYLCEWLNWRQIIITSDSCSMEIGIH